MCIAYYLCLYVSLLYIVCHPHDVCIRRTVWLTNAVEYFPVWEYRYQQTLVSTVIPLLVIPLIDILRLQIASEYFGYKQNAVISVHPVDCRKGSCCLECTRKNNWWFRPWEHRWMGKLHQMPAKICFPFKSGLFIGCHESECTSRTISGRHCSYEFRSNG